MILTAHFSDADGDCVTVDNRYYRMLNSNDQLYMRKLTAGTKPVFLDFGWVKEPRVLVVTNEEGKHVQKQPVVSELEPKVLELLSGETVFARLRPGETMVYEPVGAVNVRAVVGQVRFTVHAVPG